MQCMLAYLNCGIIYNCVIKSAKRKTFSNHIEGATKSCKASYEVIGHNNSPIQYKPVGADNSKNYSIAYCVHE